MAWNETDTRTADERIADFRPYFARWSDDEMANCAICLAHMIDKALTTTLAKKVIIIISTDMMTFITILAIGR